jgi:hypothetical protein
MYISTCNFFKGFLKVVHYNHMIPKIESYGPNTHPNTKALKLIGKLGPTIFSMFPPWFINLT